MKVSYPLLNKTLEVNSGFGQRWGRQHKGIDLAAEEGTRVVSVLPGRVVKAGNYNDGYGGQVLIKHDLPDGTLYTRYAHLKKWYVRENESVTQDERIGESGGRKGDVNAGRSDGPHLHFEVLSGGMVPMDPEPILRGGSFGEAGMAAALASSASSSGADEKESERQLSKLTSNGVVDKFMAKASKTIWPVAALASLKGLSSDDSLKEEVDRIKQLLK